MQGNNKVSGLYNFFTKEDRYFEKNKKTFLN